MNDIGTVDEIGGDEDRRVTNDELSLALVDESPALLRYALSLVGDRSKAEDLVSDTIVKALEKSGEFKGQSSIRTWLHRILHNLAVDAGRHGTHELTVAEVEQYWRDDTYSVDAAEVAEKAADIEELREALLHVAYQYRAVLVLHDAERWSMREVAALLDISLPAAKQRLRRGRMMLVSALARSGEGRSAKNATALTCWEARSRVSDYIDGELAIKERESLEEHMKSCSTCPPLYGALVGVTDSLGTLHDPDSVIPPKLADRIREHLGERRT